MIDWGASITLLGDTREQIAEAQRELARIGIDDLVAAATGAPETLASEIGQLRSIPAATFADLAKTCAGHSESFPPVDVVLDVRTTTEYRSQHLDGVLHIPLHELTHRLNTIPNGTIWVHCRTGYRATAAASLLAGNGCPVVVVDDDFTAAAGTDLKHEQLSPTPRGAVQR